MTRYKLLAQADFITCSASAGQCLIRVVVTDYDLLLLDLLVKKFQRHLAAMPNYFIWPNNSNAKCANYSVPNNLIPANHLVPNYLCQMIQPVPNILGLNYFICAKQFKCKRCHSFGAKQFNPCQSFGAKLFMPNDSACAKHLRAKLFYLCQTIQMQKVPLFRCQTIQSLPIIWCQTIYAK